MDYRELKDCREEARRGLLHEMERLQEQLQAMDSYMQVMDATDELFSKVDKLTDEVERQQREIANLEGELEQKEREKAELERQLLAAKNERLAAEASAKPTEIHNHFEAGSNSQVFNGKVKGKFTTRPKTNGGKERKEKKKWQKIVRKML